MYFLLKNNSALNIAKPIENIFDYYRSKSIFNSFYYNIKVNNSGDM